jgi:two-component system chemotaxis response regulator CheB
MTNRTCKEAEDGEKIAPGVIYIAPGGKHLIVTDKGCPTIVLSDGPRVNFCKPAVDPMFDSVAEIYGAHSLGVVFTGMGADGAAGSVNVSKAGGSIIAQDEKTSVVWGMPGATAHTGVCSAVMPLSEMADKVRKIISGRII